MDYLKSKPLIYASLGFVGCYIISKIWNIKRKKKYNNNIKEGEIYLIDSNIDHLFSVRDLIVPKADAFDKPHEILNLLDKCQKRKS